MPDPIATLQHVEVSLLVKPLVLALFLWASFASIHKFLEIIWAVSHWQIMGLQVKEALEEEEDEEERFYFNRSVLAVIGLFSTLEVASLVGIKILSAFTPNQFLGRDWIEFFLTLCQVGAGLTGLLLFALVAVGFHTRPGNPQ